MENICKLKNYNNNLYIFIILNLHIYIIKNKYIKGNQGEYINPFQNKGGLA